MPKTPKSSKIIDGKFLVIQTSQSARNGRLTRNSGPYDTIEEAQAAQKEYFTAFRVHSFISEVCGEPVMYADSSFLVDLPNLINDFMLNPTVKKWRYIRKFSNGVMWQRGVEKILGCPKETCLANGNYWRGRDCSHCSYNVRKNGAESYINDANTATPGRIPAVTPAGKYRVEQYPHDSCVVSFISQIKNVRVKDLGTLAKLCLSFVPIFGTPPKWEK